MNKGIYQIKIVNIYYGVVNSSIYMYTSRDQKSGPILIFLYRSLARPFDFKRSSHRRAANAPAVWQRTGPKQVVWRFRKWLRAYQYSKTYDLKHHLSLVVSLRRMSGTSCKSYSTTYLCNCFHCSLTLPFL